MYRQKARPALHFVLLILVFTSLLASPAGATQPANTLPASGPAQDNPAPQGPLAIPNLLDIPFTQLTPKIDGICTDYASSVTRTFADGGGNTGTVYLIYTNTTLYVCMEAATGSFDSRFAALYLDPQGDGINYVFADKGDYSFRVNLTSGAMSSYIGNGGPNGWTPAPALDPAWSAAVFAGPINESVEWALDFDLLNFGLNCGLFGLGVYHHWFSAIGDDYGWPSNQWFDQPRTWQLSRLERHTCGQAGRIAFVFRGDTASTVSFYNLLVGAGYTVDLIPLGNVLSIPDFAAYDLILIADDSGSLDQWGSIGFTAQQVDRIKTGNKPIIGLGEGGYAFFGQLGLFIGWPNGWHGPQDRVNKAATAPAAYYAGLASDPVVYTSAPLNSVGIYLGPNNSLVPGDATVVGLEDPTKDHAPLIMETCRLLWGNSGSPTGMTADGQVLFLNAVGYMRAFQCPPLNPTPPPTTCVKVEKTASPAPGSTVSPGTVITYTVTVTYSNNPTCENVAAKLIDSIPLDTTFVPGSATGGISPASDGSLNWAVNPGASPQVFSFKVVVDESQCNDQRMVNNRAGLIKSGFPPFISNVVSHSVECPPILLPNDNPNFVEEEVQIHPYPLSVGYPSQISVRVTNLTSTPQPVMVQFQTSPDKFGIGLTYATFDTRAVTLPASGSVIVQGIFVPVQSGHFCIQIVVSGPALATPLVTQRNLDVTEDLTPGLPDILTFKVGNPTPNPATIQLVVVNTCPGWTAAITNPPGGVLSGMAPGEVRTAELTVTPPLAPALLGSGCHIDVEGWIGDQRIGGIRKLDVPPVNLPVGVQPPWEEPEISFIPDPPVLGRPNQLCILLQNPLDVPKNVTVDFAAADFGAGIGFTPVGSLDLTLPPHSLSRYCVPWTPGVQDTPGATGTLHRCVLVTLKQAGYQDMHSQRNVDLVRVRPGDIGTLDIPFVLRNPDLFEHTLGITLTVVGLDPYWHPMILTVPGGPPPDSIMGGQTLNLHLRFAAMAAEGAAAPPSNYRTGDVSQVEVGVYLDGELLSGFSVVLDTPRLYLPVMAR